MKKILICGNFNVVHAGHVRIFEFAKKLKGKLIVGVYCDRIAGKDVFIGEKQRLNCVRSNIYVDEVHLIKTSLKNFITKIKPRILVKGQEFEEKHNEENKYLLKIGAKLIFGSGNTNYSSIDIISNEFSKNKNKILHERKFLKRHAIKKENLTKILKKFSKLKVGIVGDSIVDEYVSTNPIGMSREDTVIAVSPLSSKLFVGGAAIVAAHASTLKAKTSLFSVSGKDKYYNFLKKSLKNYKVNNFFIKDESRSTNLKTRFNTSGKTLLKVNSCDQRNISKKNQQIIFEKIKKKSLELDLIVFSDFNFGCLPKDLACKIITYLSKQKKLFISADSQTSSQLGDLSKFKNVTYMSPTEHEARVTLKDYNSGLVKISTDLMRDTGIENLILTLNKEGILIQGGKKYNYKTDNLPSLSLTALDPSGCGDAFLITSSMAMVSGATLWEASYLGSIAAALQVQTFGNMPLNFDDLITGINDI